MRPEEHLLRGLLASAGGALTQGPLPIPDSAPFPLLLATTHTIPPNMKSPFMVQNSPPKVAS